MCWFLLMVAALLVQKRVVGSSKEEGGFKRLVIAHECVHGFKQSLSHIFGPKSIKHMGR